VSSDRLARAGGIGAVLAIPVLLVSVITLALFFGGAGAVFGPLNDLTVAMDAILLLPAVVALAEHVSDERRQRGLPTARWFVWLSGLAVAGFVLIAVGQVLLVLVVISLEGSFLTGGVGVLPVLAWLVGIAWLGLRAADPAGPEIRALGRWAAAVLVAVVVASILSATGPDVATIASTAALLAIMCGFLWQLGTRLLRTGGAPALQTTAQSAL
jgi:hypothetical protein